MFVMSCSYIHKYMYMHVYMMYISYICVLYAYLRCQAMFVEPPRALSRSMEPNVLETLKHNQFQVFASHSTPRRLVRCLSALPFLPLSLVLLFSLNTALLFSLSLSVSLPPSLLSSFSRSFSLSLFLARFLCCSPYRTLFSRSALCSPYPQHSLLNIYIYMYIYILTRHKRLSYQHALRLWGGYD